MNYPKRFQTHARWYLLLPNLAGPVLLTVTFLALFSWSWRKWPDPLIDFPQELYLPWQLSLGKRLYADVTWEQGPFSQYWNALWFRLFGASFTTLIVVNGLTLAALTAGIFVFFRRLTDHFTATVVGLVFLCVFGFSQYIPNGNYNYITPYRHESLHGLVFSLGMLFCFSCFGLTRRPRWMVCAGICFGLVFLTKIEFTISAGVTAIVGLFGWWVCNCFTLKETGRLACFFSSGMGAAIGAFLLFLWMQMPFSQAWRGVGGNWFYISDPNLTMSRFYQMGMGFDQPAANLTHLGLVFGGMLVAVTLALALAYLFRTQPGPSLLVLSGIAGVTFGIVYVLPFSWLSIGRPLPLIALLVSFGFLLAVWRCRHHPEAVHLVFPITLWAIFSFLILGKMMLNARLFHYGFLLAMPATLLTVAFLLHFLPKKIAPRWGNPRVFQAVFTAILAVGVLAYLNRSHLIYSFKTFPLGTQGNRMYTFTPEIDATGLVLARIFHEKERRKWYNPFLSNSLQEEKGDPSPWHMVPKKPSHFQPAGNGKWKPSSVGEK